MKFISYISVIVFSLIFISCTEEREEKYKDLTFSEYSETFIPYDSLEFKKRAYVPVYSHIYHGSKGANILLTATLSIRNTSFKDSLYVKRIDYFDSKGNLLKNYVDQLILLEPMHALEFIVEEKEDKGGTGANFVVDYGYDSPFINPLIQAVMIGTSGQQGISFLTQAIDITPNDSVMQR